MISAAVVMVMVMELLSQCTYFMFPHTMLETPPPRQHRGAGCKRGAHQPKRGQFRADTIAFSDQSPDVPCAPPPTKPPT